VQKPGFRVKGAGVHGFRVQGSGFSFQGSEFGGWGLWVRGEWYLREGRGAPLQLRRGGLRAWRCHTFGSHVSGFNATADLNSAKDVF
jgi:hypothetical protein